MAHVCQVHLTTTIFLNAQALRRHRIHLLVVAGSQQAVLSVSQAIPRKASEVSKGKRKSWDLATGRDDATKIALANSLMREEQYQKKIKGA